MKTQVTVMAHQYSKATMLQTGHRECFLGETYEAAVESCRYYHALSDGGTFTGPTGKVVHSGRFCYVLTQVKSKASGLLPMAS